MFKNITFKEGFARNVLTLMTGTTVAQLIPLMVSPILTRIYSPEEFGLFALCLSITSVLSIFITGRYELAIMLPKSNIYALNLVVLCFISIALIAIFFFSIVIFFQDLIFTTFSYLQVNMWVYFVLILIILNGIYQTLNFWCNRHANYRSMSLSRIVQSFGIVITQILLSTMGVIGLVLGMIIGLLLSTLLLFKSFLSGLNKNEFKKVTKLKLMALARRYIKFPKFLVIAHGLNTFSTQTPVFLLNTMFLSSFAGFYMLTQRVIAVPSTILASAIGDVFREKASKKFAKDGDCYDLSVRTLKILFSIAIVPFATFFFIAPTFFSFIFGEEWRMSGYYAQILTPMYFFKFISSPLSNLYIVTEKQKQDLIFQTVLLISALFSFIIIWYLGFSVEVALTLFSTCCSIAYILNIFVTLNFSKKY